MNPRRTSIECLDGRELPRKCSIEYVSFSAHVDFLQNSRFIKSVQPDNIVLVHGTEKEMKKLKAQLEKDIRAASWPGHHKPTVTMPANLATVTFQFNKTIVAELVGSLCEKAVQGAAEMGEGSEDIMVFDENICVATENFTTKVFAASDLHQFTPYRRGKVYERIIIPFPTYLPLSDILIVDEKENDDNTVLASPVLTMAALILGEVFDKICAAPEGTALLVEDLITVSLLFDSNAGDGSRKSVAYGVQWEGTPVSDMAADCIVGVLTEALSAPSLLLSTATSLGKRQMDSFSMPAVEKIKMEEENDEKVKAMKACLIDPSKAINHKKFKSENGEDADSKDSVDNALEKLKYIRESLEATLSEESSEDSVVTVSLNALGDRLIVQRKLEDGTIEEAYCMIEFAPSLNNGHHHYHGYMKTEDDGTEGVCGEEDDGGASTKGQHHAVVYSEKDSFRAMVLNAFQGLV